MASIIKAGWFGRQVGVVLLNGKKVTGELTEVSDQFIVLNTGKSEVQIMGSAIMLVALAPARAAQAGGPGAGAEAGPEPFS